MRYARSFMGEDLVINTFTDRVMLPFLASLLGRFVPLVHAFATINFLFWLGSVAVCYALVERLFGDRRLALAGGAVFATSNNMIWVGASVLSNPPVYFFTGLAAVLALRSDGESLGHAETWFRDIAVLVFGAFFRMEALLGVALYILWRARRLDRRELTKLGKFAVLVLGGFAGLTAIGILAGIDALTLPARGVYRNLGFLVANRRYSVPAHLLAGDFSVLIPVTWVFGRAFFHVPDVAGTLMVTAPLLVTVGFLQMPREPRVFLLATLLLYAPILFSTGVSFVISGRIMFGGWPAIIPPLVYGLKEIAEGATQAIDVQPETKRRARDALIAVAITGHAVWSNYTRDVIPHLLRMF